MDQRYSTNIDGLSHAQQDAMESFIAYRAQIDSFNAVIARRPNSSDSYRSALVHTKDATKDYLAEVKKIVPTWEARIPAEALVWD